MNYDALDERLMLLHTTVEGGPMLGTVVETEKTRILHFRPSVEHVIHEMQPDCWCSPKLLKVCDECSGADAGCWKCGRGFLGVSRDERAVVARLYVIHK